MTPRDIEWSSRDPNAFRVHIATTAGDAI